METKKTLANIRQMHRDVSNIFLNEHRRCYEYLDDFVEEISLLIRKFEIFPYHMLWECISQRVPEKTQVEDDYILRDAAKKEYRNVPIKNNEDFNYPKDEYFRVPLNKKDFSEKFVNYFKNGTLKKVFDIPLKPGFSYFNLPVFSEDKGMPQWILTLIYRQDNGDSVQDEDFLEIMEHLSYQIGLAWDKFLENTANKLLRNIDNKLVKAERTSKNSTIDQLRIISRILSQELHADWCGFFLFNEQENTLKLEVSNIDPGLSLDYPLTDFSDIMVNRFINNEGLSLFGRKILEDVIKTDKMKPMEKGIRAKRKKKRFKDGNHYFTPYVLFEHALFLPIAIGDRKTGLTTLFRAKKAQEPEPQNRFTYLSRPFSEFENHLLRKVRRYVFNIFIFNQAMEKRVMDIKNMIAQVTGPISEAITYTGQYIPGAAGVDITNLKDLFEKLRHINALSRITVQYAKNFETLLDLDAGNIKPKKEKISDLRKYLIHYAILYTPLIRRKSIHVNVTRETASGITLEVDQDLFDVVISNIIDNAIKYSFDRDNRLRHELQYTPDSMEDKENVLITAKEENNSITITVSSYGVDLTEEEKEKIFDREFRGGHYLDRPEGAGVGLYVAKEIIRKHGGTIEIVPNTPDYNTMFKITLPKRWGAG